MPRKDKNSSGSQWFLRTGADAEFGPVEKQGLLLWAEQARILPGHEVSSDRKNWKSAVSVDFLDMCWFIDEGDGDLKGPLNRKAAETLIKSGKFSDKAQIVSAADIPDGDNDEGAEKKDAVEKKEKTVAETPRKEEPKKEVADVKAEAPKRVRPDKSSRKDGGVSDKTVLPDAVAESNAMKILREESQKTVSELNKKVKALEERLRQAESERKQVDASSVSGELFQNLKKENDAMRRELASTQKKQENLQGDLLSRDKQIEGLERKLNEKNALLAENERKLQEAVQVRERALQQSRDSERSFARLLSDANKRDVEYKAKIDALKKNISLSPDQTDRFYNDQNAIYQILKRELDDITKVMESERKYLDSLKTLEMDRLKDIEKRRQVLQNHMGNSPVEMTSRVLREQTSDPNAVRMRSQFDNLKIAHERATHRFQERERDLTHKLKVAHSDYNKLMNQLLEKEREGESLQLMREQLAAAEHELAELRRSHDAERKQFVANNNALAARVVELEGGSSGNTPGEVQASEAKNVKLASWMTFRK